MKTRIFQFLRDCRGSSAAEFTLCVLVLVVIIFGTFDVGRLFWEHNRIMAACQAGVRFAVVNDIVATDLMTFSGLNDAVPPIADGELIPADAITDIIVCNASNCIGDITPDWGHNSAAYDAILDRATAYYPRLLTDPDVNGLKVTYDHIGLGRSGWSSGPEVWPLTTVDIGGFDFQFFTPLVGAITLQIPKCRASMTGEDFQSTPTL